MRIGVFGGEFDPPHVGHLVVAQEARYALALDRLLIVPVGIPPHRSASLTPPLLRHEMARIAFEHEPDTEVSTVEIDRGGPSFTVDTLQELAGPEVALTLVMGADQYAALHRWREPERIRELAAVAVARRPGAELPDGADLVLDSPLVDLSSTELRERIAGGRPVNHLVPAGVLALIQAEGLYAGTEVR
jgi:nicotinate-nucleotide adenylyltransferase